MGRTEGSEKTRAMFLEGLKSLGYEVDPLKDFLPVHGNLEVYRIKKGDREFAVAVSVSEGKGFWGLGKWVFECFKGKAFFVFLEGAKRGYCLTADEFDELRPSLKSDKRGDFKVHEKELDEISSKSYFFDLEGIFDKVLKES